MARHAKLVEPSAPSGAERVRIASSALMRRGYLAAGVQGEAAQAPGALPRTADAPEREDAPADTGSVRGARHDPCARTQSEGLSREHPRQGPDVGIGPAGTGKTYLAVARKAVQALQSKQIHRIILSRPAVGGGGAAGFLRGDSPQKIDPYLRPLYDALHDMVDLERIAQAGWSRHGIEVAPLAFMRGRSLNDSLHHPRRGAEHHPRADEDVPDPPRHRLEGRGHRRRHPDRSACRENVRPAARDQHPAEHRGRLRSRSSKRPTSCGIRSFRKSC